MNAITMNAFVIIATLVYLLLGIIWSSSGINSPIKAGLFLLAGIGGYLIFTHHLLG